MAHAEGYVCPLPYFFQALHVAVVCGSPSSADELLASSVTEGWNLRVCALSSENLTGFFTRTAPLMSMLADEVRLCSLERAEVAAVGVSADATVRHVCYTLRMHGAC
jgi:hypothetical protein